MKAEALRANIELQRQVEVSNRKKQLEMEAEYNFAKGIHLDVEKWKKEEQITKEKIR